MGGFTSHSAMKRGQWVILVTILKKSNGGEKMISQGPVSFVYVNAFFPNNEISESFRSIEFLLTYKKKQQRTEGK